MPSSYRSLSTTAFVLFLVACAAPTDGAESQSLAVDGSDPAWNDGMTDADKVTPESIEKAKDRVSGFVEIPELTPAERAKILAQYGAVKHEGVRESLYENAVLYYHFNVARIPNKRWITVLDFALHSKHRRFVVLDTEGGPAASYPVAHGAKSDPDDDGLATLFSNVNGSNQSSVGHYLTGETYVGGNGRSLRLDGLSKTNSNARERLIVVHGADYVADGRPKQGRSLGCPALPHPVAQGVIDKLQNGSLLYGMN